jgi:hypothetical protein
VQCKFGCRKIPRYRCAWAATETFFRPLLSYFLSTYLSDLISNSLLTSTFLLPAGHDELCLPPYLPRELTPNPLVTPRFDFLLTQFYLISEFNTQLLQNCLLSPQTYPRLLGIKWYITSRTDDRRKSASSEKVLSFSSSSFLSDFLPFFLPKPL